MDDRGDYLLLAAGVLCASLSPPLIAATAAPALAIAFWRTGRGGGRDRARGLRGASSHAARRALALLAGFALAAHFGTFIPSLSYTSVSSATALVCSQAVWAGLLGRLLGERLPRRAWLGTAVCLSGVLLITGVDASLDGARAGRRRAGAAGGVFGGAYIVTGGFARRDLTRSPTRASVTASAGLLLLVVCLSRAAR